MAFQFGRAMTLKATRNTAEVMFPREDDQPPLLVGVEVRDVQGVPQVVAVSIRSQGWRYARNMQLRSDFTPQQQRWLREQFARLANSDPEPEVISSELLRALPLRELKNAVLAHRRGESGLDVLDGSRSVGRERKSPEHYREVSRLYEWAVKAGLPTHQTIAEHFSVGKEAAHKYIKKARELGFLAYPAKPGVVGASEPVSPIARPARRSKTNKKRGS